MYQCNIKFYMVGFKDGSIKETIMSMPPMENFFHDFVESDTVDKNTAVQADVIFAYISDDSAGKALDSLTQYK